MFTPTTLFPINPSNVENPQPIYEVPLTHLPAIRRIAYQIVDANTIDLVKRVKLSRPEFSSPPFILDLEGWHITEIGVFTAYKMYTNILDDWDYVCEWQLQKEGVEYKNIISVTRYKDEEPAKRSEEERRRISIEFGIPFEQVPLLDHGKRRESLICLYIDNPLSPTAPVFSGDDLDPDFFEQLAIDMEDLIEGLSELDLSG